MLFTELSQLPVARSLAFLLVTLISLITQHTYLKAVATLSSLAPMAPIVVIWINKASKTVPQVHIEFSMITVWLLNTDIVVGNEAMELVV